MPYIEAKQYMKRFTMGAGIGLAFVLGACGWVMQAHKGSDTQTGAVAGKLAPTADQMRVAELTSLYLAENHYLKDMSHTELSSRMWNEYLSSLDPRHMYLLQSDVDEFAKYRTQLQDGLLNKGDMKPGFLLYNRLLERVDQQNAYVKDLLAHEKFDFSANDSFPVDRKSAPRPANLDEARKLWRDYLRYEYLQEKLNKQKPEDIVKALTRRYTALQHAFHENDRDDILQLYLNALSKAYDPHTDYFGKAALERFNTEMKLSLFGIGALLEAEDGYCKIAELTPGGVAEKSKLLRVGDRIVAVAQDGKDPVDVVDMKLDKIVAQIRGPKGTRVHLTIVPAGVTDMSARKKITLTRDEIKLQDQEAKAKVIDYPQADGRTVRIGVIDLPAFYYDVDNFDTVRKSCVADVARLLQRLDQEKIKGLILDLRNNPGGSLSEVEQMAGLFVKPGPVVQVKNSAGQVRVQSQRRGVIYEGPLVVLTSRASASAAEILSGVLQDYGRAVIVGDSATYGKGTVQSLVPLDEVFRTINFGQVPAGAIKPTIQKYYRVTGSSVQLNGVISDIVLPSVTDVLDIGEKTLDYPMPWDRVPPANFAKVDRVGPVLAELKQRSATRVSEDKAFQLYKEEIAVVREQLKRKAISLNEQKRQEEKRQAEARTKRLRAEIAAAQTGPKETVYQVTLQNVDKPELMLAPPPKAPVKRAAQPGDDPADATAADETPARDLLLGETERILLDYIDLESKRLAVR